MKPLGGGGGAAPLRASLSSVASDAFENTFTDVFDGSQSDVAPPSPMNGVTNGGGGVGDEAGGTAEPLQEPGCDERGEPLPKPAHLIKAEMGIVLSGERHVLVVSLADDLEGISTAWCAERSLAEKARVKIVAQLQTRLDAALAQAWQEKEQLEHAAPAVPSDVC